MDDQPESQPTPLGIYERPEPSQVTGLEIAAAAASVIWLLLSGGYALWGSGTETDALRFLLMLMVIVFPICMIWVAATAARASRLMRAESARLQVAIEAIRKAYVAQSQGGRDGPLPTISRKLDEIAAAQKKTESALAMFSSSRTVAAAGPTLRAGGAVGTETTPDQPTLALGTSAEDMAPPLSNGDFIRALNFPETADDTAGFAALRRALRDRQAGQVVTAAQDVLTLLSQEGIYMDDLRPDLARPEVWRRFAKGERGRAIAGLGGVRDRSSVALTTARMKQDPIFRDAAHHFLRLFDKSFQRFEPNASDAELSDFANTRTARAFMLLGRVAGTFD